MEQNNQSYLTTEKVGKLMGKYAVPCIISLLVGALYNIVDQIFIANAGGFDFCLMIFLPKTTKTKYWRIVK